MNTDWVFIHTTKGGGYCCLNSREPPTNKSINGCGYMGLYIQLKVKYIGGFNQV
jgi:hypothetical protein